jgi:V-type H+-transporting ATPase subunit a
MFILKNRFLAGIMHRDKIASFELMLWRFCRGNVFIKTAEIEELVEDSQTVIYKFGFIFLKVSFYFFKYTELIRT